VLAALLFWGALAGAAAAACTDDGVDLRGTWGQARFAVELADDDAERAQGLMFRESLPSRAGMLFVYPEPRRATFWMRNTLIPLDMIFIGPDGVVRQVHAEAVPGDETTIDGGSGILAVLEINGGQAARFGIGPGTEVRHPAFGDAAIWSCAD
jgi:uncharacterized membrane protein (UPF0127 family)